MLSKFLNFLSPRMKIKPNNRYQFLKSAVLGRDMIFKAGEEFKTDDDGNMPSKVIGEVIEKDILEVWLENGNIEDMSVFKPKEGQQVWYISSFSSTSLPSAATSFNYYQSSHKYLLDMGNVFKTYDDAVKALSEMREYCVAFYSK